MDGKKGTGAKSKGKAKAKKKEVKIDITARVEFQFLQAITSEAPQKDIEKVMSYAQGAMKKRDDPILQAALAAVERICEPDGDAEGFLGLLKVEGLETVGYVSVEAAGKDVRAAASTTLAVIYARTVGWLDGVDPIDFNLLPQVMQLGSTLAGLDEDIAGSTLGAMERFAMHALNNAAAMLESGALQIAHLILSAHRTPELCGETMLCLFRLCDVPGDLFAQHLLDEKELILSIVETLDEAPLNMRLQVAGFRLLCLWNQPEVFADEDMEYADMEDVVILKDKLRAAMKEAGVVEALDRALTDLRNAGLHHQAAWISTMAGGCLVEEALISRVPELMASHGSSG